MKRILVVLLSASFAFQSACSSVATDSSVAQRVASDGPLVIVGGGGTTDAIRARALELARGAQTRVVVLPQASSVEERGVDAAQMWLESGAREARVVEFAQRDEAVAAIEAADLIWIGGGDQSRFMREARDANMLDVLRERHRAGVVIGGTSAGAAVMTEHMLTGDPEDAPEKLSPGSVEIVEGLGLFEGAIVDQHFVVRRRNNRLLSAVLSHPSCVGYGIDERTALIVLPGELEVLGDGTVVVFDARGAQILDGAVWSAVGVDLSVLRAGDGIVQL